MSNYLKSWSKRIGVVTLVVALSILIFGFLPRSWFIDETPRRGQHPSLRNAVVGSQRFQYWGSIQKEDPIIEVYEAEVSDALVTVRSIHRPDEVADMMAIRWQFRLGGFGLGFCRSHQINCRFDLWYVPIWAISIPPFLLSAYLLLSEPRNREKIAATAT